MSPENGNRGFRDRLAERIGDEEPFRWARRVGVPTTTFGRVWNDGKIPKTATAAKMAAALGVSLDWLLTGAGDADAPDIARVIHHADEDLMSQIGVLVGRVHRDAGVSLPPAQLFRLTTRKYNEVMAAQPAEGDVAGMLKLLEIQLRAELRDAEQQPGTGKRSA